MTIIAYYFREESEFDRWFWRTEFAFLKTFETQGLMPSVLVVNKSSRAIERFCEKYSIAIQISANLVPGDTKMLALDLVQNLHARFQTPYVLTIQDDGFPLRSGLGDFVGKWDYIGAPWVRHISLFDFYPRRYCVGNGGFSLRSKKLCSVAADAYRHYFAKLPYHPFWVGDDTFYCKTLRFWFRAIVKDMKWPTPEEAALFSLENANDLIPSVPPLGFHSCGFAKYRERFSDLVGLF